MCLSRNTSDSGCLSNRSAAHRATPVRKNLPESGSALRGNGDLAVESLFIILFCVAALVAPIAAAAQNATADTVAMPGIEIALRPERNKAGNVESVLVTFQITDTVSVVPTLEFRAPIELNNIPGIADRIRGFRVDDSVGVVLMTREDDSVDASGFGHNRRWRTARSVSFPVTVGFGAKAAIEATKLK